MNRKFIKMADLIEEISMGPFGSNIKVDSFVEDGIPVLNGSNISGISLTEDSFRYVTTEKADSLKKANAKRGDIVITHRGTLGQIAYIPESALHERYVISQSQFKVRLKTNKVCPIYFTYYFHTNEGQNRLLANKSYVGVPALAQATTNFKLIDFPYRPLLDQQKISHLLSTLDAKIHLNNQVNAELEKLAKTIYDYWFVQFDFPDAQGRPYKSSGGEMVYDARLGREIPAGWGAGPAKDIIEFNPTEKLAKDKVVNFLDMGSLPTSGYMTNVPEKKAFKGGMKFRNNDTLLARITPCLENGKTCFVTLLEENEVGFGSTEFIVMRGLKSNATSFIAFFARSEYFRKYAIINMTGTSGRKRVDYSSLEIVSLPIPPDSLLTLFEENVAKHFNQMTANQRENAHLTSLRDWLLPLLMNGQVGVRE